MFLNSPKNTWWASYFSCPILSLHTAMGKGNWKKGGTVQSLAPAHVPGTRTENMSWGLSTEQESHKLHVCAVISSETHREPGQAPRLLSSREAGKQAYLPTPWERESDRTQRHGSEEQQGLCRRSGKRTQFPLQGKGALKEWRTRSPETQTGYFLGLPAQSRSKTRIRVPDIRIKPQKEEEEQMIFVVVVILNPKSWRSDRRDGILPGAGLGSCYQAECRLEMEMKCSCR